MRVEIPPYERSLKNILLLIDAGEDKLFLQTCRDFGIKPTADAYRAYLEQRSYDDIEGSL